MLRNYLKIAVRAFLKQKGYTLLNVFGLAVSLAVAALIVLFIQSERSYDQWIPNQANIFRVYRQWSGEGGTTWTPPPLSQALRDQFPEVRSATRISDYGEALVTTETNKSLYVKQSALVDSCLLNVLPLPLQSGDARTALNAPYSAIITDALARKLYGNANPLGKTVRFDDDTDYKITGVLAPPAGNTHLQWEIYLNDPDAYFNSWSGNSPQTYAVLHPQTNVAQLEGKVTKVINGYLKEELTQQGTTWDQLPKWRFQPLADIHLYSTNINGPFDATGDYRNLYLFGGVAFIILLIASINYMNLATAQAAQRAKEVGVRKVNGATKGQLVTQFLTESALQSLLALPLAVVLAMLFLPAFNVVTNRDLSLGWTEWWTMGGYMLALVLLLGLISGSYPAFFLSAYNPTDVLKGKWLRRDRGRALRQTLVVAQFTMAIAVAIVMTFIYKQVRYMQDQELGFRSEQVLVIPLHARASAERIQSLKTQLRQNPRVESISYSSSLPGTGHPDYLFQVAGVDKDPSINIYFTEPDFIKTLDLKMAQGRFFSADYPSDTAGVFVVNEAFVKKFNIASPIGHRMRIPGQSAYGTIIGVIRDFHYESLQNTIEPLVLYNNVRQYNPASFAAVRVSAQHIRSTIAEIERLWKQVEAAHPMQYTFLDDDFARLYNDQTRLGQTMLYATLLTIFVASLGLFGLASFMAEQRTKEIGVRKVLGASVGQIVVLLGKDFLKLVLIAGIVAVPVARWIANEWIANFAYRTSLSALPFILAILFALLLAALTVSIRAIKAARVNPVNSLRSE